MVEEAGFEPAAHDPWPERRHVGRMAGTLRSRATAAACAARVAIVCEPSGRGRSRLSGNVGTTPPARRPIMVGANELDGWQRARDHNGITDSWQWPRTLCHHVDADRGRRIGPGTPRDLADGPGQPCGRLRTARQGFDSLAQLMRTGPAVCWKWAGRESNPSHPTMGPARWTAVGLSCTSSSGAPSHGGSGSGARRRWPRPNRRPAPPLDPHRATRAVCAGARPWLGPRCW
jgi:hypothetical protein